MFRIKSPDDENSSSRDSAQFYNALWRRLCHYFTLMSRFLVLLWISMSSGQDVNKTFIRVGKPDLTALQIPTALNVQKLTLTW